ncbi:hypothetical protein [Meiothermus taiwanensis]|jgi:hypothetical protein|uniref:Uncharacterized protein n=2 Tax=Meiothermus taiwanensis TaxID=172827 RepID=A0A399DTK4_9DEIN|nr:hypothetical protein [Meiothermus taiwanensis]AWR87288.1 hypothetical protein Mtai_v1c20550 [Meiothermus taiwanensis WR-220]KIQ54752.1 hypothetical protein SY28_07050 [Meiothermus taiwanensis]KZK16847.1 hypothetical protein A3962_04395 [Meiothermus taiwanensis]RIH75377.1 hypothetical protein Mcate_02263 [Meiothermus taiwanensis]
MRVEWQEVAIVAAIAGIFTLVAQIPQVGFWTALLPSLAMALLAAGAYRLLMPWIIGWAAKGAQPPKTPPDEEKL